MDGSTSIRGLWRSRAAGRTAARRRPDSRADRYTRPRHAAGSRSPRPRARIARAVTLSCSCALVVAFLVGTHVAAREPGADARSAGDGSAMEATAIFAGGCFWCMEPPFDELDGVTATISGYTGGRTRNPSYEEVSSGGTGHAEAVRVRYDPARVTYRELLDVFWHNVDPVDSGGQFCDRGDQYRSAIFYSDEKQKTLALKSRSRAAEEAGLEEGKIATEIVPAQSFYPAEEYHQDYYMKNPVRYHFYRFSCGRDGRLNDVWGDTD